MITVGTYIENYNYYNNYDYLRVLLKEMTMVAILLIEIENAIKLTEKN